MRATSSNSNSNSCFSFAALFQNMNKKQLLSPKNEDKDDNYIWDADDFSLKNELVFLSSSSFEW